MISRILKSQYPHTKQGTTIRQNLKSMKFQAKKVH